MPETGATYRPKALEVIAEADVHQQFDRLVEAADRWLEGLALTFTGTTIHLAPGKTYQNGYLVTFGSTVNEALASGDNTYYVFTEPDADITVNTSGIPPADSIKIWEVVVSGGVITGTTDFRDRTLYLSPPIVAQGGLDADGNEVTSVGTPTATDSAANKQYVDDAANAAGGKATRAASTGNVNIAAPGTATFDGVTLANGEDILLKDQSTASQNGIYVFNGSGVPMTRRDDFDTSAEVKPTTKVAVSEGTVNKWTTWRLDTAAPITLGATSLSFVLDSVQGQRGTTNGLATLTSGVHTEAERPTATTAVKGDVLLGNAAPPDVAAAGSAGTANDRVANADHTHGHGNQAGGSLHSAATGSVAGFMSAADKTTYDARTSAATPSAIVVRDAAGRAKFVAGAASGDAIVHTQAAGGDLTGTYPSPTVANNAVTNAKAADMAQTTVKGRAVGAGTGDPTDLTAAQLVDIIETADGAGSGLDADTVDGVQEAKHFRTDITRVPDADNTINLGSAVARFQHIYAVNVHTGDFWMSDTHCSRTGLLIGKRHRLGLEVVEVRTTDGRRELRTIPFILMPWWQRAYYAAKGLAARLGR